MNWLTTEEAARLLNRRTDCFRVTACLNRKRGDEHFKLEGNKTYVREDFIDKVKKTHNAYMIYDKLTEKYGTDWQIAEALADETNTSINNCYQIISTLFYQRRTAKYCMNILRLYKMVGL